jgi:3'(2'), 5'-bisphosphate nucleotidase
MNDHELARKLARETGALLVGLREHAKTLNLDLDRSSTLVKQVALGDVLGDEGDQVAHNYLLEQFSLHRPQDVVLSEEGDLDVDRLGASRVWIIDPLDGTAQYSTGGTDFAVHVALWDASSDSPSKICVASVAVPARNELWSMDEPVQSYLPKGDQIRILVSRSRPPREIASVAKALQEQFPERGEVQIIPMGSVGAKVGAILSGQGDVYFNSDGFYEWDLAAPLGIACHNGLTVTACDGSEIELNKSNLRVKDILISRPELTQTIVSALNTR